MNVEEYRKTIRRRMNLMATLCVAYGAIMIAKHALWEGSGAMEEFAWSGVVTGFAGGALTAMVLCFAILVPRYGKAMRDEQALRRLWNSEHDERLRAIRARAGAPMILYTSLTMVAIGLLIGPWNLTVAMTLLFAGTVQILISVVVKLVCMRTM
ncbi:MAG: hypothetical protein J1E43_07390 [Christensenellaceae bacterium]|nr:hypothetical protein [Christensenellaceae bacterium]